MRNNKKMIIILLLMFVVLGMGVGYSILSKQLKIEGTATIGTNFDVAIAGIQVEEYFETVGDIGPIGGIAPGEVIQNTEPNFIATTASFDVTLKSNSSVTYAVTIENKGDIPAVFNDVTINQTGATAVKVETPLDIKGYSIYPGETQMYYVTLSYHELSEVNENQLTSKITITFDAQQKTTNTEKINKPYIVFGAELFDSEHGVWGREIFVQSARNINAPSALYISIDGSEYELVESRNSLDGMGGTCFSLQYKRISDEQTGYILDLTKLEEGQDHIIKLKLLNDGVYSNELTLNYSV